MDISQAEKQRVSNLSLADRKSLYLYLEGRKKNGELPRGSIKACAKFFPVAPRQVGRVFKEISDRINTWKVDNDGDEYPDHLFQNNQRENGAKRKHVPSAVQNRIKLVPLKDRMNLQVLSGHIDVPMTTLHRIFKEGHLYRHRNVLKPKLTDRNKKWRYEFARSKIDWDDYDFRRPPQLSDMMDVIHIDEKWFYLLKDGQRYYMVPGEELPHLTTQSKNFLPKVMFLSAVARPRWLPDKNQWFDCKIGVAYWIL